MFRCICETSAACRTLHGSGTTDWILDRFPGFGGIPSESPPVVIPLTRNFSIGHNPGIVRISPYLTVNDACFV
jgi:hypothetical protein